MKKKEKILSKAEIINEYFRTKKEKIKAEKGRKNARIWYNMMLWGSLFYVMTTLIFFMEITQINVIVALSQMMMVAVAIPLMTYAVIELNKYDKKD